MKLVRNDKKVIYRDESKLHKVPTFVVFTMPIVLTICVASGLILVVNLISGHLNSLSSVIFGTALVLSLGWGIFTDKFFNFYNNCRYDFTKDISYKYELDSSVLMRQDCTVTIKILYIDKLIVKGQKLKLVGNFIKTTPRQGEVNLKRIVLQIDFVEREYIISELGKLIKKGERI